MKMQAMKVALEELNVKPIVKVGEEPTDGLWFRHCTPIDVNKLMPLNYKELAEARPGYNMDWRRETEQKYHDMFYSGAVASPDNTFLYATVCGCHRMESHEDYNGFTYYFRLTPEQIENTIFEVIDAEHRMEPMRGQEGLDAALKHWEENKDKFTSYHEENLGDVHPRIEVIIPYEVLPELYFPPKKDR